MIHTTQIARRLTLDKFNRLAVNLFDRDAIRAFLSGQEPLETSPNYPGINSVSFTSSHDDYLSINLVINPQTLISGVYTLELFTCTADALQQLSERFNIALDALGLRPFPPLLTWYPRRVDYAADILTQDVAHYVELGKRERRPRGFTDRVDLEGSTYPESRQVTLNFYNKCHQVESDMYRVPAYAELLEDARNTFRVEVQCYQGKVKALRRKYGLPNTQLGNFLDEQIARETILYYYGLMFGYQDFYSIQEAHRIVDTQAWRSDHKDRFKAWLRSVADADSFAAAREAFTGSSTTLDNYMKDSRTINVNPITLPEEWGIPYLPNPMPLDYRPE